MWKKWKAQTINWKAFILVMALIILAFISGMFWNRRDLDHANLKHSSLQYSISLKEKERSDLQASLNEVGTKPYIETRARKELLYLRPEEIRFEVKNAELLDYYTDEEYKILMEEMAFEDD